jgi:heme exporter protein D
VSINWGSLLVVCLVSLAVGIAVVALVAFALVGLSARRTVITGGADDGARPALAPAAGTAVAAVCLFAVAAIVGYGLWIIVS